MGTTGNRATPCNTMQYHMISCDTMQYHAIPCDTIWYHSIPCNIMQYHVIPWNTMQYHAIPCTTMQYHAIPCNTMQYHSSLITATELTTALWALYGHFYIFQGDVRLRCCWKHLAGIVPAQVSLQPPWWKVKYFKSSKRPEITSQLKQRRIFWYESRLYFGSLLFYLTGFVLWSIGNQAIKANQVSMKKC